MAKINNTDVYLKRMAGPLKEKIGTAEYLKDSARTVLDVGCADGAITRALAKTYPHREFLGIDLEESFIEKAKKDAIGQNLDNARFECVYLRDLLARQERFDAVIFLSVLHEFFTYGEGISSVLKALADAHELLNRNGQILIRDMVLHEHTKHTAFEVARIIKKVRSKRGMEKYVSDFERMFGRIKSTASLNHFLLKYRYTENWEREGRENYIPVTFEQYRQIFSLLDMELQFQGSHRVPFMENAWKKDFRLTDKEISLLSTTGILVAQKK